MTFQDRALNLVRPEWNDHIRALIAMTEAHRPPKDTKTGTISGAACAYLEAVTTLIRPAVIVEVGTFIGTSILAMRATKHKYTCDKDHGILQSVDGLTAYPMTRSTKMLEDLVSQDIIADFMFFDGRAQDEDLELIQTISRPGTVYGFDDFEGQEKGIWNVRRFIPWLPRHVLVAPPGKVPYVKGSTTIALLIPWSMV